jgi:hypothetical protein
MQEPPAGLIRPGSPVSIQPTCQRAASCSSTPPGSTRSRSTTPSARCPPQPSCRAGSKPHRPASASASRPRSASRTSSGCWKAPTLPANSVKKAGKLGPLLFQLPPNFKSDNSRLAAFLKTRALGGHQLAFEFRHESWFTDATFSLLRKHNAALCVAESDDLTTPDIATADFRCYRLRRNGGYKPAALKTFAKHFAALAQTAETYVYFKHED